MTPYQIELDDFLRDPRRLNPHGHKVSDSVRERMVRLNPNGRDGYRLRGYHAAHSAKTMRWVHSLMGKGEFIRRHGSAAWRAIPNGLLHRYGRHKYITAETYVDNIWKVWSGEIIPRDEIPWYRTMIAWFPTKKYANDPDCVVEMITAEQWLNRRAVQ